LRGHFKAGKEREKGKEGSGKDRKERYGRKHPSPK